MPCFRCTSHYIPTRYTHITCSYKHTHTGRHTHNCIRYANNNHLSYLNLCRQHFKTGSSVFLQAKCLIHEQRCFRSTRGTCSDLTSINHYNTNISIIAGKQHNTHWIYSSRFSSPAPLLLLLCCYYCTLKDEHNFIAVSIFYCCVTFTLANPIRILLFGAVIICIFFYLALESSYRHWGSILFVTGSSRSDGKYGLYFVQQQILYVSPSKRVWFLQRALSIVDKKFSGKLVFSVRAAQWVKVSNSTRIFLNF